MRLFRSIACLCAMALMGATAHGQMSLDLNIASGDQGERERQVKPGETFAIELLAAGGAKDQTGFSLKLRFDAKQVTFKGVTAGGLMAGAMSMPAKKLPTGVEVSAAIMGLVGASADNGSLGQLLFEATPNLTHTAIAIASASFGSRAGIVTVETGSGVKISNPDAPAMPSSGPQPPAVAQTPKPPSSGSQGFQNPPGGSPPMGTQPPTGPNQGRGNRRGQGNRGQGTPPGNNPPGAGQPPQGFTNPGMGGQGQMPGGQQGHMQQPGQHQPMNPEEVIKDLPTALQSSFKQTMEVEKQSERAHVEAELAMLRSVRGTLEETKKFLSGASASDQEKVGKALWFFHMQDEKGHDPMGRPGQGAPPQNMGSPGGRPMGQPGMGPGAGMPKDANEMVRKMIQEVEGEIKHLEQALQHN